MSEARTPGAKRAGPGEYVFNMNDEHSIERIVSGERVGTLVKPGEAP